MRPFWQLEQRPPTQLPLQPRLQRGGDHDPEQWRRAGEQQLLHAWRQRGGLHLAHWPSRRGRSSASRWSQVQRKHLHFLDAFYWHPGGPDPARPHCHHLKKTQIAPRLTTKNQPLRSLHLKGRPRSCCQGLSWRFHAQRVDHWGPYSLLHAPLRNCPRERSCRQKK